MLRIKKIIFGTILGVVISFALSATVSADIIWEPANNFFREHRAECEELGRDYFASGEEGYISLYTSPISEHVVALYKNGHEFGIRYSYTDSKGKVWGMVEQGNVNGWLALEELVLKYDNIAFCEENEDKFKEYKGEYDEILLYNPYIVWTYPGSGVASTMQDSYSSITKITYTYKDENENVWGYYIPPMITLSSSTIGKGEGYTNYTAWVCLNDPYNVELPKINLQEDFIPAIEILPTLEEVNKKDNLIYFLIGALAILVSLTAGIVVSLKMKKK